MVLETDVGGAEPDAAPKARIGLAAALVAVLLFGLIWAATRSAGPGEVPAFVNAEEGPATAGSDDNQAVVHDGQQALAAWGEFAVTGDLTIVEEWFDADGPQYGVFAAEAANLASDPLGPPAYIFTMSDPEVLHVGVGERIMRGAVHITRAGEQPQQYGWDLHLRRSSTRGRWMVWTANATASP